MSLRPGARVGPYEIVSLLGAGGMGEVYRARDGVPHRDVALKIVPHAFEGDLDRVARFRRQAQVLAALNHPNIGHIYGVEPSPWYEIVGVAENLRRNPIDPDVVGPTVFYPIALEQLAGVTLTVRLRGSAAARMNEGFARTTYQILTDIDPALRMAELESRARAETEVHSRSASPRSRCLASW